MPRRLVTVESALEITGRGLVLAPSFELAARTTTTLRIEVRRPDGSSETLDGHLTVHCDIGAKVDRPTRFVVELSVPRSRVPVGSEIWTVEE